MGLDGKGPFVCIPMCAIGVYVCLCIYFPKYIYMCVRSCMGCVSVCVFVCVCVCIVCVIVLVLVCGIRWEGSVHVLLCRCARVRVGVHTIIM